jgi:hypothetical protein
VRAHVINLSWLWQTANARRMAPSPRRLIVPSEWAG